MLFERIKEAQVAWLGLFLLVGLVLSSMIMAIGLLEFKRSSSEVITVTGAASKILPSDYAQWQSTVSTKGGTMAEAYGYLKKDVTTVIDYLKSKGVPAESIKTRSISAETVYGKTPQGYNTNEVQGYILRQPIQVESDNVDLVETVSSQASELLNKDIVFEPMAPEYFYTKLDSIKVQMLGLATENAKQRAKAMAESTGNHIGLMRSAQMGVFQITAKNSTDVSDSGILDTTTREKKVTAVVNVSFAVR